MKVLSVMLAQSLSPSGLNDTLAAAPVHVLMVAEFGTTALMIVFLFLTLISLNVVLYSRLMFARKMNRYLDGEIINRSHQLQEAQSSLTLKNEEVKRLSEKILTQQVQLVLQQQVMKKGIDELKRLHHSTDLNLQEVLRKSPAADITRSTKSPSATRIPSGMPDVDALPNKVDQEFLGKVSRLIEQNIANPELDHKILCDQLAMSKSVFYGRFKSATGQGLQEYIKILRLKNSVKLLMEGTMNIQQVAMEVGFNSQSYFNKCFIRQYGMGPKAYSKMVRDPFSQLRKTGP